MDKQQDIEIYIRDCAIADALSWVESKVGRLSKTEAAGDATIYATPCGPLIVTPEIEGGPFISLHFSTPSTPWRTDVECARDAARELGCTVRCDPGHHYPDVHPCAPRLLELVGERERLVDLE